MDYKNILQRMHQQFQSMPNMSFQPPAQPDAIRRFEAASHITLPTAFRQWLEISDGGELFLPGGVQLYGAAHKPLLDPSDRIDGSGVIIGRMAFGDPIIFQEGSETVAIYNQEAGRIEPDEVFDDFCVFLWELKQTLGIGG